MNLLPQLTNKTLYDKTFNAQNIREELNELMNLYDKPSLRERRRQAFQQWIQLVKPKEVVPAAPFEAEVMYSEITLVKSFENLTKSIN